MRKVSHLMVLVCFMLLLFPSCKKGSSDYVQTVKQGVLDFDKSLTVGDAYDNYKYFVQKEWTSFETEQKRIVVQFKGELNLDSLEGNVFTDENVNILKESIKNIIHITQFNILKGDKDVNRFEVRYCGFLINYKNGNEKEFPEPDLKFISSIYQNEMSWEQYKTRWVLTEIIFEFNEEKEKKRSDALKLEAMQNLELLWKQCFTNCGESFYGIFEQDEKEMVFEGKGKVNATLEKISLNSVDSKVACRGYTKIFFETLRFWNGNNNTWSDWQSKESVKDELDTLCLRSKFLKEDGVWKLDFSGSYKIKKIDCANIPVNQE